ncbi:MAG: hypothetical protein SFU99_12905 [Saprospiraceae bacterium]|nr:hypothetical protein [Saprospiraceae bacterium]
MSSKKEANNLLNEKINELATEMSRLSLVRDDVIAKIKTIESQIDLLVELSKKTQRKNKAGINATN